MAEYTVGAGGEFGTLAAAIKAAKPGDVVRVLPGVYRETVKITTANLTIIGEPGAILDGGYSHEWAKISGAGWRDLRYKAPPAGSKDMILVAADGVTLDGLTIRNAPGSGVAAGAVTGLTVRGCSFDHIYGTGIKVNGTTGTATDILIEGNYVNAASVRIFDNSRTYSDPQGVSGAIKVGNARGVVIRGNVVVNCFGEGINQGKNLRDFVTEGNVVADCNHKHFYCNAADGGVVRKNVAVCTGHPAHLWTRGRSPAGFAAVDETPRTPYSGNLVWEGNLAVNMGIPIQINPRGNGKMTVRDNTFVAGPLTRLWAEVKGGTVEFAGNIIVMTPAAGVTGAATITGPNLWTAKPPKGWGHADDVVGDPLFIAPVIPGGPHDPYGIIDNTAFNPRGYELRPNSPAVKSGKAVFGALGVAGQEPPVEPDPPDEPEPPVEPDPPVDPVPALKDALAQGGVVLEELKAEHEQALASVAALARQIRGTEMMLRGLEELIALLEDE